MSLEKIGLKPEHDPTGKIGRAVTMLEGYAINQGQRIEALESFASTVVILSTMQKFDTDLIVAQLIAPVVSSAASLERVRDTFGKKAADIASGVFEVVCAQDEGEDPEVVAELIAGSSPAVRQSLAASNTALLESAMAEHGYLPSGGVAVEHGPEGKSAVFADKYFANLRNSASLIEAGTLDNSGNAKLDERHKAALAAVDGKIAELAAPPSLAPAFGQAFRALAQAEAGPQAKIRLTSPGGVG